jgi:hypothetical protein
LFLCLLKNVEIVIISNKGARGESASASFKGFGESIANILCAVHSGGDEFRASVFGVHRHFYDKPAGFRRRNKHRPFVFSDIGDKRPYGSGGIFQTRTAIGANYSRKTALVQITRPRKVDSII